MESKVFFKKCMYAALLLTLSAIPQMFAGCNAGESNAEMITVMNPAITEMPVERVPLAPRLENLDNKTIYLVDINYEGMLGTPVMKEIQKWFTKNQPEVKTVYKLKKGSYVQDDPELWKEIKNDGDGVIVGVAG